MLAALTRGLYVSVAGVKVVTVANVKLYLEDRGEYTAEHVSLKHVQVIHGTQTFSLQIAANCCLN